MLDSKLFVEYPEEFSLEYKSHNPSPIFRYNFEIDKLPNSAVLEVCGLGIGYYYLNELAVSDDLFTAAVSDYDKTLWYNTYDVLDKLTVGENLFAVILGNGFYNESIDTTWGIHKCEWRALPKFALKLKLEFDDQVKYIVSNEDWLCSKNSPVLFNELRSGETYDFRIGEDWKNKDFDTSDWTNARFSKKVPKGVFRLCDCQPIRKFEEFKAKSIFVNANGNYVIDFGQNVSGFVRVKLKQSEGTSITIRYTERLFEDGICNFNRMNDISYYRNCDFQTDRLIFSGKDDEWTPRFTYHGFRYIEVEGLDEQPEIDAFTSVFVHQAVDSISSFECSDDSLNSLWNMAKISSYSNMFYSITDCPTREKLGWLNDAQASCEQMLQNYDIYPLFKKWLQDIFDTTLEDGQIPGIAPCYGWGYEWGTGPVSSGIIFELPYRMYRYTGEKDIIYSALPFMIKHFKFILSNIDETDGLIGYGLIDWSGPFEMEDYAPTPVKFSDTLLTIKFAKTIQYFAEIIGETEAYSFVEKKQNELTNSFSNAYILSDGTCSICEQTAISMLIVLGMYDDITPLKNQLISEIKKYNYHHHCGMLGLQYLFKALTICGVPEIGYELLMAEGHPSFVEWLNDGGTTLYEHWNNNDSNNHHMFSCFAAWLNMTVAGICLDDEICGFKKAKISPWFIPQLDYCKTKYRTVSGEFSICWERKLNEMVELKITIPKNTITNLQLNGYAVENGNKHFELCAGEYVFACKKDD